MSTSVAIPVGNIRDAEWCYQGLYDEWEDWNDYSKPRTFNSCANSTRGTKDSDFASFCCDGSIIGFFNPWPKVKPSFSFDDLTCCRHDPNQQGGILPIPDNNGKTCTDNATPTPLASLAATSTGNAQPYWVTYKSGKGIGTTVTDWIIRETPSCFWVDMAHGVEKSTVEVEKAQISTLPPQTDKWGEPEEETSFPADGRPRRTTSIPTAETTGTAGSEDSTSQTSSRVSAGQSESTSVPGTGARVSVSAALCVGLLLSLVVL